MQNSLPWISTQNSSNFPSADNILLGSEQLSFFPKPFVASQTFSTAHTPWYMDYGHLTFWFFFFASFIIIAWLGYVFWALVRGIEQRQVVRETRGYSRAQTGDTLTAVLPLTWSITMLVHAGTHSSNFDENTNSTVFSFTVIAYQWGWNYYFPQEIAELLTSSPKVVGRGRVISGKASDSYSSLLARSRRDYLAQLSGSSKVGAKHGRFTLATATSILLPVANSDSVINLPNWSSTRMVLSSTTSTEACELWGGLGFSSAFEKSKTNSSVQDLRALSPVRGLQGLGLYSNSSTLTDTYVSNSSKDTYSLLANSTDLVNTDSVTWGWRSPISASYVGNRLSYIHNHLGYQLSPSNSTHYLSDSISKLLRSDVVSCDINNWADSLRDGELSVLKPSVNLSNVLTTSPTVFSSEASYIRDLVFGKRVVDLQYLGGLDKPFSKGSPIDSLAHIHKLSRGSSLRLYGGDDLVLTSSDTRSNLGAAANELLSSQSPKSVSPFSFLGLGSFNLSSTNLNPYSKNSSLSALYLSSLSQILEPQTHLLDSAQVQPNSVGQSVESLTPSAIKKFPFNQHFSIHKNRNVSRLFNVESTLVKILLKQDANLTIQTGFISQLGGSRIIDFTPLTATSTNSFISYSPLLESSWLEGPSESKPVRSSAKAEGDLAHLSSRTGGIHDLFNNISGQLQGWRSLWSWHTASASLPYDRNFRAAFNRKIQTGLGSGKLDSGLFDSQLQEITALQRQRFDKNALSTLIPHITKSGSKSSGVELGRAVLDNSRGYTSSCFARILPLPYVDIDPTFMNQQWSNEINTSRRGDHDARYKVTWGPLSTSLINSKDSWKLSVGPKVNAQLTSSKRLGIGILAQEESWGGTAQVWPSMPIFKGFGDKIISTGAQLRSSWVGESGQVRSPNSVLAASWRRLSCSVSTSPLNTSIALGPWGSIWELKANNSRFGGDLGSMGSVGDFNYWSLRLLSSFDSYKQLLSINSPRLGWGESSSSLKSLGFESSLLGLVQISNNMGESVQVNRLGRSGYQPIQSSIGSQRRLRVTKGIYLPADLPLHGIFGSKDVIHSWAIPGMGIKIDCIPGYSSHRRVICRWRGLYWGQCMEVCGRYHHWMPILVRVVHKDIFLLWCLAYLRLLNNSSLSGSSSTSINVADSVWSVASSLNSTQLRQVSLF